MANPSTFRRYVAAVIVFSTIVSNVYAKYSGGSGTAEDPYQIATADDLIALGETPGDYDKHFIMTDDIDLDPNLPGGRVFDKAVIAWHGGAPFHGVFDGNGHTISNLTIVGESYLGLFGIISGPPGEPYEWVPGEPYGWVPVPGGVVCNLALELVDIHGTGECSGGLAGASGGTITAVCSSGRVTVRGDSELVKVGGLVGKNTGDVARSCSTAAVSGAECVGGLVGANYPSCQAPMSCPGTITDCHSGGPVNGDRYVGGLVGGNFAASITDCYGTGTVSGDHDVGGLRRHQWRVCGRLGEPGVLGSH
jgi:hypothetical protein